MKAYFKFIFAILGFILSVSALAQNIDVVITSNIAPIYATPSSDSKVVGRLQGGRRVKAFNRVVNGFIQIKTKSGRQLWLSQRDIQVDSQPNAENDILEASDDPKEMTLNPQGEEPGSRLTWDLGVSAGSTGDINYTEANLGLNYFFKSWLAWRNSFFYRFVSEENIDDIYGLDSMARLYYKMALGDSSGFTLFGGPGYRFVSEGDNVPFAEAGLILKLAGLSLGGGVKTFFTKLVDEDAENDTQFFIVLSGSGVL